MVKLLCSESSWFEQFQNHTLEALPILAQVQLIKCGVVEDFWSNSSAFLHLIMTFCFIGSGAMNHRYLETIRFARVTTAVN